jgi:polyisoprenoid-binding protein YceI
MKPSGIISTLLTLGLAGLIFHSPAALAKKHEKEAAAQTNQTEIYKLDSQVSSIDWKGSKATGASHNGTIKLKDGQVEVKGKKIQGGLVVVEMSSLVNKDLEGQADYKAKLEGHLKSEDFFNVSKFPESSFKIKSVTKKSDSEFVIKGEFTMIGSTQEVEVPAQLKWEGNKIVGTADLKLDRTKWGLKYGSGKFFKNLGDKLISDDFELKLNLVATKDDHKTPGH